MDRDALKGVELWLLCVVVDPPHGLVMKAFGVTLISGSTGMGGALQVVQGKGYLSYLEGQPYVELDGVDDCRAK